MKYVMGTVAFICLIFGAPIMLSRLLSEAAASTAQAEMARGQADALREQAAAQGDLMRAQAAITLKAADAVDADRRAAHGIDSTLAALAGFAIACICVAIAFLVWQLRMAQAQLRAIRSAHAQDDAQRDADCAQAKTQKSAGAQ